MPKAYDIEDADMDDLEPNSENEDGDLEETQRKPKKKAEPSDVDDGTFDELPRGIKFPDEKPVDEDEETEEGEELEEAASDEEDEDEDEAPRKGENRKEFMARLARERRLRQEAEDDRDGYRASLDE